MKEKNIALMMSLDRIILQPCDLLFFPIGIIWFSFLHYPKNILMTIIFIIFCYFVFQILAYITNIIISLLYMVTMPIIITLPKGKFIGKLTSILLHIVFFTTWSFIAYYFLYYFVLNPIDINYIKPMSLILYALITQPFISYVQRNINTVKEIALTYLTILKLATCISCITLTIFEVDIKVFCFIFVIIFLCNLPFFIDAMDEIEQTNM